MDLKLVREEAIEQTNRFFSDRRGFVPSEDSDEWEDEYRRQFELAKARHASDAPSAATREAPAARPGNPAAPPGENWARLTGEPTQTRWAATLREDRLREIRDPRIREWLATTWTRARSWIDTMELPTPVFLQRIAPHYQEYRKKADEAARLHAEQLHARRREAMALRRQVEAAGISVAGLIELIDVCDRLAPVPFKEKLAELDNAGRNLRVFSTEDPLLLMVLDKDKTGRSEYAIERDDGLVADLELWMRATAAA